MKDSPLYSSNLIVRDQLYSTIGDGKQFTSGRQAAAFVGVISRLPEEPTTLKQAWLIQLRERLGIKRTCIALANKTVRTAWAILRYETEYQQQLLVTE